MAVQFVDVLQIRLSNPQKKNNLFFYFKNFRKSVIIINQSGTFVFQNGDGDQQVKVLTGIAGPQHFPKSVILMSILIAVLNAGKTNLKTSSGFSSRLNHTKSQRKQKNMLAHS